MSSLLSRAAFALALALAFACEARKSPEDPAPYRVEKDLITLNGEGPISFEVATAREGPPLPLPPVTARITTVELLTAASFAPLSGRIVETKVRLGDQVQKGQQLVRVRSSDLPSLRRDLQSAELAVATRSASVSRMRTLIELRAGAEHDLLQAESELEEAKLMRSSAAARLKSLQIARDRDDTTYWVLAPRSGTIVQLEATFGAQVGPDKAPVATISDLAEVLAVADVSPRDALAVTPGAPVAVAALDPGGPPLLGSVEMVSDVVDPERQTVPVRVRFDNRARLLRPNAYVDLTFRAAAGGTCVLVPSAAVVRDGPSAVVFVETAPGSFARRKVLLGRVGADEVELTSGVKPGERVVTRGALLLLNALDIEA